MLSPDAEVVTPEDLHPDFFGPVTEAVKRVSNHRFAPIVSSKKHKALIKWMLDNNDDMVPDGCLGYNVNAKAGCKKQLLGLLEGKQMVFEQKVVGTDDTPKLRIGRRFSVHSTQMLWVDFRATIFHKFLTKL